jgi:[acyl-carrier-protein] S-malonyltransferase
MRTPLPDELPAVMARQLMSPVKFTQSMELVLAGPEAPSAGLEVGPGNVLTGLMKRIAKDLPVAATGGGEALRAALAGSAGRRATNRNTGGPT